MRHRHRDLRPAFAGLMLIGCSLVGCQAATQLLSPPPRSAAVQSGLAAARSDGAALFLALETPPPRCAASGNTAAFAKVQSDLAALGEAAAAASPSGRTASGVAKLQSGFSAFEQASADAGATCLPAPAVASYQATFDQAIDRLAQIEQLKPAGARS